MFCNMELSKKQSQFIQFSGAIVLIIIIALAVDLTKSGGSHHTPALKLVIVVTRHGTRGPMEAYPNDPYKSDKYWPDGHEALTSIGKIQLYNIGVTLRQLYDGFINTHYSPSEFRAYSTLIERTLQSAESLLAGLYPPKDYQQWNANIDWQPVPVYPNNLDKQNLPSHPEECTRFWKLQNDSILLAEDNSNETRKIIQVININSGLNITSAADLTTIWDSLSCEYYNGMKLPEWTKAVFPSPLNFIWSKQLNARLVGNEEMTRLVAVLCLVMEKWDYTTEAIGVFCYSGLMIQSFVGSMEKILNDTGNNERRMLYYSSHDHTVGALLSSLGFIDIPIIYFAHTLLLELHSHPLLPSGNEVKLFQIDGTSSDRSPRGYDIPNCTTPCDFNQFVQLTKKYYDGLNFTKECQL